MEKSMDPQQQPNQPQAPSEPQQTPVIVRPVAPEAPRKSHKKLALSLLIAPTAVIILSFLCFIVASQIPSTPVEGDLFGEKPLAATMLNIVGFAGSALGVITWLPGLIIGIVLLVRKK